MSDGAEHDAGEQNEPDGPLTPGQPAPDEGPGWMPAVMAGLVLLGIVGFIGCSVMTWLLYRRAPELALRTMRGTLMPSIEQSMIEPDEKEATLKLLDEFTKDLQRGKYEHWQARGVMTRMVRVPLLQWGDLEAVEAFVDRQPDTFQAYTKTVFSRLRWGVELDKVTAVDFDHVLDPVMKFDDSLRGQTITDPMSKENVAQVIQRAKEVVDRLKIEDKVFDRVYIDQIVNREINAGIEIGTH